MSEEPQNAAPPVAPEDLARANVYGILARLFYVAPDAQLLAALANAEDDTAAQHSPLGEAWRARFGRYYPAMALVEVSGLVDAGALIEMEATAVIGGAD